MEAAPGASVCPACAKPLLVRYALDGMDGPALIERWSQRLCDVGMWRFREILPPKDEE